MNLNGHDKPRDRTFSLFAIGLTVMTFILMVGIPILFIFLVGTLLISFIMKGFGL
tara:strand:+ start:1529 stop:1693 length:165 start_codon:yes stop_codon:yes gene_type:complete